MIKTTKAQRQTLYSRWKAWNAGETYRDFRKRVYPVFMSGGAIAVTWCGMHLCIEPDGHPHT
jgi:hypothetical protein